MKKYLRIVVAIFVVVTFATFFNTNTTSALRKTENVKKPTNKITRVKTKAKVKSKPKIITKKKLITKTIKKTLVSKKRSRRKSSSSRSSSSRRASTMGYGELLDWWTSASEIFTRGKTAIVTDLSTGKSFNVMRTMGTNHADTEALTKEDTEIIKSIWGGFSWDRRPVIVNVDGRRIAASMSAMPHAGLDSKPAYEVINNRSDNYGTGDNLDVIKDNGMDGHFDIHFLNSTRHKDGKEDMDHQKNVLIAAGK